MSICKGAQCGQCLWKDKHIWAGALSPQASLEGAAESIFGAAIYVSVISEFGGPWISVLQKCSERFPPKSSLEASVPLLLCINLVLALDVPRSGFHQVMKITEPFIWEAAFQKNLNYLLWLSHSLPMITV